MIKLIVCSGHTAKLKAVADSIEVSKTKLKNILSQ